MVICAVVVVSLLTFSRVEIHSVPRPRTFPIPINGNKHFYLLLQRRIPRQLSNTILIKKGKNETFGIDVSILTFSTMPRT